MRRFAALFEAIDQTTSTNAKVAALVAWFSDAPAEDAAWVLWFLTGNRFKRLVPAAELRALGLAVSGLPSWLFDECQAAVGDSAETLALLVESEGLPGPDRPLHAWIADIRALPTLDVATRATQLRSWWASLHGTELFLLNKLLTGAFRVGVSHTLVVRALARVAGIEAATVAHRLMGTWEPSAEGFRALLAPDASAEDRTRPYPFMLASPLEGDPAALGPRSEWVVEWKWDGIRAQVLRREGTLCIWSRGEELVTDRFPELLPAIAALPVGTVLDGEVLGWRDGVVLPFADLQTRIGRKKLDARVLAATPVTFLAFDLLEDAGADVRHLPLAERRRRLAAVLPAGNPWLRISEPVEALTWESLAELRDTSRARRVEGFMLKRVDSAARGGRHRGDWWKWKIEPFTVDAVLLYAQPGNGKRAGLHTDMTFGVWDGPTLVPVAKAYTGLTNAELEEMDRWIRRNTVERHGPVRALPPERVFEIAFEGIALSTRHRSGVAVRFPRILRARADKSPADADTLETLRALIRATA
jgi:DNA ligase-1